MSHNFLVDIDWDNIILETMLIWDVSYNRIEQISKCNDANKETCTLTPYFNYRYEVFDISYNRLKNITQYDFTQYKIQNKKLDFSHNEIEYIHPESFTAMSELASLNLGFNKLANIENGTFDSLSELVELKLNNN
jgi:Leucine-rich repeat (LRR) protein